MRKIKVVGDFITLYSGRVRLDKTQARAPSHSITLVKDDLYEINGPIGFKRGEVFYFDGEVGKGYTEDVEETRAPGRPVGTKKSDEKADA